MTDIDWRARAETAESNLAEAAKRLNDSIQDLRDAEQELSEAYAAVSSLNGKLTATREDSARLEWMIEHGGRFDASLDLGGQQDFSWWDGERIGWMSASVTTTPRAAIDEARKAK